MPTRQDFIASIATNYGDDMAAVIQRLTDCGLAWNNSWMGWPNDTDPGPAAIINQWFQESGMQ